MSHQNKNTQVANAAGIILALIFIVVFAIIATNTPGMSFDPTVSIIEDEQIADYVEPTEAAQSTMTPESTPDTPTSEPTAEEETVVETEQGEARAATTASYDPQLIAHGQELFMLCSACHGPDARGIPGLGKDLVVSEFVDSQTDDELLQFITTGRPIWDPANTTGIDMPPKGGNPAMTNDDIMAIIAYIRSLQAEE